MDNISKALDYFSNSFNCAQSVFTTFATQMGMNEKTALMVSTGFGGGARNGEICGAVSGALMVLGLKFGHFDSNDKEQKAFAYKLCCEFCDKFRKANKSIVCRELLGYDLSIPEQNAKIREKNLFKTVCPEMIKSAVIILEDMLKNNIEGGNNVNI